MAKEKIWSKEFKEYMETIITHSNYKNIPFKRKRNGEIAWIASKKSDIGKKRIEWAQAKAKKLGFPIKPGVYAKVMFEIHPTKKKPCQICGKEMSLYYIYLNASFVKEFYKKFKVNLSTLDSIFDAVETVIANGVSESKIKKFLIDKFKLSDDVNESIKSIIYKCEAKSRNGKSKLLGPGAMSNYPDRLDGFHTYNRCCRQKEDTGRHKENMKTYNKDRRAYEYWSDGNIHAANKFMNSSYFKGTSADHIGPISLGFKHDPLLLQKMSKGDNSSKRDRLLSKDIELLIKIENENPGVTAISWFSEKIWLYIKQRYAIEQYKIDMFRDLLKQNMANYMEILWIIKEQCGKNGERFLIEKLLSPKFGYFKYSYKFNEKGQIIKCTERKITDATRKEIDRFIRVAFEAVEDYHEKNNRNLKSSLDKEDVELIKKIYDKINYEKFDEAFLILKELVENVQNKLLIKVKES
ncbi:hypothetical protein [Clostridium sp.]|jgi:Alw26I/Eco31I/Esp3I family type II restriction endonuclease|uniref:hypothetical protein n=1 Tax=Clostridium sp. TaxID=1506 RepID=UPI003A5C38AA